MAQRFPYPRADLRRQQRPWRRQVRVGAESTSVSPRPRQGVPPDQRRKVCGGGARARRKLDRHESLQHRDQLDERARTGRAQPVVVLGVRPLRRVSFPDTRFTEKNSRLAVAACGVHRTASVLLLQSVQPSDWRSDRALRNRQPGALAAAGRTLAGPRLGDPPDRDAEAVSRGWRDGRTSNRLPPLHGRVPSARPARYGAA